MKKMNHKKTAGILAALLLLATLLIPYRSVLGAPTGSARFSGTDVTLNIGDMDSGEVSDILMEDFGIAVRSGAHCAPRMHEALGTTAQGAVRFSFGYFNTEADADAAIEAVRSIAEE